jgi:hypothetical protein
MPYNKDREIENKFAPQIKTILAQHFITKNVEADLKEGQDFGIYCLKPFNVGVRLRTFEYFKPYNREFTIRWSRPSGAKTEIHKIREGLVDFILYGFLDQKEQNIIQYFIGDLKYFGDVQPCQIRLNDPPDSELAVFKFDQFPRKFFVAWFHDRRF